MEWTYDGLEDLEERNMAKLINASQSEHEFTENQKRIISRSLKSADRNMRIKKERQEDINELLEIAEHQNYEIVEEQLEALKLAYKAYDLNAWLQCRFALEIFFDWETEEDIKTLDLSGLSLRNLIRWMKMLEKTNMACEPKWQASIALQNMIEEQIANSLPFSLELRKIIKNDLRKFSPEMILMLKNTEVDEEKRIFYLDLGYITEAYNLSEQEVEELNGWVDQFNQKANVKYDASS